MATLLLTAVGTLIGGPVGGALGALAGQQLDTALIGTGTRRGPRLKELAVQSSSYGAPIVRCYGRMRIAGSVIWATELKEHRDKQGGGKGRPKTVTYSYTSSFAVALASRPIVGIGRVWADGNLLRGAEGDLKVAGALRLYHGHRDQPADPLLAAAEGAGRCPAFRGVAYAVFEDLALADFGNRIPSLSFEIIADNGVVTLAGVLADLVPDARIEPFAGAAIGFAVDGGTPADTLATIGEIVPLSCVVDRDGVAISAGEPGGAPIPSLPEPVGGGADDEPGSMSGFNRQRERLPPQRTAALRYYDVARDYQPGVQRGRGRSLPGDAAVVEFPASLEAGQARALADALSRRGGAARETATYRIAELDPAFAPGCFARLAGDPAAWRIDGWEWSAGRVELSLRAFAPGLTAPATSTDPGRANLPADLAARTTVLAAFELPWDGVGAGDTPALYAALSAAGAGWTGAALFAEAADASLLPLGGSGRTRAVMGTAAAPLSAASPHVLDRTTTLEVNLVAADLALTEATPAQLAMGANRALIGEEIIQFARAAPLGGGRWALTWLLRGRGGTEPAIRGHAAGERFVLLDEALVALDPAVVGEAAHARVAALGLGDQAAVISAIGLAGATRRPLSPVHGRLDEATDGALALAWTRRARGAWLWRDGVEVPLGEPLEAWVVTLGDPAAPEAVWETAEPVLAIPATLAAQLRVAAPGAQFTVRQRGAAALSAPLALGPLV